MLKHSQESVIKSQDGLDQACLSSSSSWLLDLTLITTLLVIFYFIGLGSYPLFTPDEGRYSEVAREMLVSGDFITPRLNGVVFLDKPILYYWLQASALKIFGLNEWAVRFWPVVTGIWGCLMTYISGRLLFSRRAGFLSATILATTVLYYGAAHYANLDLEVAIWLSSSLFCALLGLKNNNAKTARNWIYSAYFFAALAILTKGLIGIAFPLIIIGAWTLILRKWSVLKKLRPFSGLAIILSLVLPWYVLAQKANPEFLHFFFVVQQFSRFLSTTDFNNQVSTWFYFPVVLLGFLPWTLFIPGMLFSNLRKIVSTRGQETLLYLLLWVFLIFSFFSIPHSKTIGYILPIIPALALLVGQYLDQHWSNFFRSQHRREILALIAAMVLFACACFITPSIKILEASPALTPYLNFAGLNFVLCALALSYFYTKKSFSGVWSSVIASSVIFLFILMSSAGIINENSSKTLALQIKERLRAGDEIITYYKYFQDLPMYLERRITIVADWKDSGIEHNDNWLRELWYGMSFQDTSQWLIDEEAFWQRWNSAKQVYALTQMKYYQRFAEKAQARFYLLGASNDLVLISNFPSS